jgi:single-strand DNA-binding protein
MGSLNKVLLIGFLGNDPEKRVTSGGHSVVSVNLATTDKWNDKQGNKQERTEWHRLVFWDQRAEFIEQYCKKGTQLYVEGALQTKEWLDKDGNKRYTTEILVRNSQILDRLQQSGQGQNQGQEYNQPQQNQIQTPQQAQPDNLNPQNTQYQTPPAAPSQPPIQQQQPQQQQQSQPANVPNDDFIEDDIPF